ncbi:histidinol-phosphate transaminase [Clostridium sp.]|uniref:histidinol-phosphate transaminase n=1 Tax=Clostridium sp. TaxID=1506 RepID=UPI0034642B7E
MKHGGDIYTEGTLIGRRLLDFSSNVNPIPISKEFKDNIGEALEKVPLYPDIKYRELKNNLLNYLFNSNEHFNGNAYGEESLKSIGIENIIVGNGAAEILDLVISYLNSITIVVPSFVEYEDFSKKHKLNINYSFLNEFMEYDYEDIFTKVQNTMGLIIANPNNPNGCIIDHCKFKNILDYCEVHNKLVIIDEAFIEFVLDNKKSIINYIHNYSCIVIVRAITKFFSMAGVRLGYAISRNNELLDFIQYNQNPWTVNCFAEVAAKYALFDEKFIDEGKNWLISEREFMKNSLNDIKIIEKVYESMGNYFLCKIKEITSSELLKQLMEKGILIRNCNNYTGLNDSFVRIAIKTRDMNKDIIKALSEINSKIKY